MSSEYNAVQESIKIALDAADAATDVSSEFNKIKRFIVLISQKIIPLKQKD